MRTSVSYHLWPKLPLVIVDVVFGDEVLPLAARHINGLLPDRCRRAPYSFCALCTQSFFFWIRSIQVVIGDHFEVFPAHCEDFGADLNDRMLVKVKIMLLLDYSGFSCDSVV